MSSISTLLSDAKRQSLRLYEELNKLESTNPAFDRNVASIESRVEASLGELDQKLRTLKKLATQETASRRPLWEAKVRSVKATSENLRAMFSEYRSRVEQSDTIQQQRDALFGDAESGMLPQSEAELRVREADSISRSTQMVDEYTEMSQASLSALRNQGRKMKSAHRKLYDIANSLGVSRSILRVIERRSFWDKLLVYGGMATTLFVMIFMWRYTRAGAPVAEDPMKMHNHNGI
jgi:Golgi SNAP receptor complex protein 2